MILKSVWVLLTLRNIESCRHPGRPDWGVGVPLVPSGNLKTDTMCRFGMADFGQEWWITSAADRPSLAGHPREVRSLTLSSCSDGPFGRCDLRLNLCLIDQHDGDVVFDRVDPMALGALQTLRALAIFERLLTGRTDQHLQKGFVDHDLRLYDIVELGRRGNHERV